MLSVKHMSAYIEACAEAGSENGLCQSNKINLFWKWATTRAAPSFEQWSSLFPLTPKNVRVFRYYFARQNTSAVCEVGGCLCEYQAASRAVSAQHTDDPSWPGGVGLGRQQLRHPGKRGLREGFFLLLFFFFPELQLPTTYLDVSNDSCNHVLNLSLYP